MRIVSLLPSATEIVCALGRRRDLVGRSEECDYPSDVRALPVVMRARTLDSDRSSAEIDDRVRKVRGSMESLYELDLERLRSLAPDLLLTQDLCGVCSVTEDEVADACRQSGIAPRILSLTPRRLEDVWESIERVGEAIGATQRSKQFVRTLRDRSEREPVGPPYRVAVVEWLDPPILAGLWAPDIIRAAGGEPIGPRAGEPGVRTTWPEIAEAALDLVVLSPCSFSVARSMRELASPSISGHLGNLDPPLGVYVADEAYFSRPGPRLVDGIELLKNLRDGEATGPMPVSPWVAAPGGVA